MASDGTSGSGSAPGVIASLRRLAANGVDAVRARLELLANELEEERVRTLQIIVLGAVALFCASVGVLLVTALVVVALWDQHRLATLGVLAVIYFAAAAALVMALRTKARQRPKIFSASLAELTRDRDSLQS